MTDAFYAAFRVPNLLRRFLGEGSLTSTFIPVFTSVEQREGREEANRFFQALFSGLLVILIGIVILGVMFAPAVARLVAWGFVRDPEKLQLTIDLIRLTFPFLIVVALAALLSAVLNSAGSFFIPAVSPSGLSIAEIAFVVFLASKFNDPIYGLAVSAVIGGAIHFAWQIPALIKTGYRLKLVRPFSHPEVKLVLILMVPRIIGLCADQVNSFVDQFCASFLPDGSITALYNSNRIMQLPLALFGVAVSTVALPALSRFASEKNDKEFKETLNFSLRISNYILIPSLVGLTVLALPIVQVLFQHGRFSLENSQMTVAALIPYVLGLPAYSAIKILATAFYARKNTRTPVVIALADMVLHVIMNIVFMRWFAVGGLALSTAISAWFQAGLLFYYLRKETGALGGRGVVTSFLSGTLAGSLMGIVAALLSFGLLRDLPLSLNVTLSIGAGIAIFFLLSKLFKIREYQYFMNALLRRRLAE